MTKKNHSKVSRPWILVSAYDVSLGDTSEGYVAFNILKCLANSYRIILITRNNNKIKISSDAIFNSQCPIRIIGYDLPGWASWWKRGARFYQLYAYLWQLTWPLVFIKRKVIRNHACLTHVLNFHNDNIPSLAWMLGPPTIWGPINHNEIVPLWRRIFWPKSVSLKHLTAHFIRMICWTFDPFLFMQIKKSKAIVSAGSWVDKRLNIKDKNVIFRRSQLGVSADILGLFINDSSKQNNEVKLVCAGRLDWIKGIDIVIESLSILPIEYKLRIIGTGPAKDRLVKLAQSLNLIDRIVFEDPVKRNRLSEIYAESDVFVFASAEVGGLAWVEALSCGLPVVAFDSPSEISNAQKCIPGIYLAHQHVRRNDNVNSLAKMIEIAGKAKVNRENIRNEVLKNYQWSSLSSVIEMAYEQALGPPE